jgi:cytoplasmic iron level regulating protein YaaA (DUF328/UPF0246 family)
MAPVGQPTLPVFLKEAESLVHQIRQLSVIHLSRLLEINLDLAQLNAERFSNWHLPFTEENAKEAVFVFNGEVFHGLNAKSLKLEDLEYLQSHLRIFSGLYGLLKPLDLIQPYRLDLPNRLKNEKGKDLYAFWGDRITEAINQTLPTTGKPETLLNLSSGEYVKCINRKLLNARVIDVDFLESKNGVYKPIVVYIKKARGLMTRYVVENRLEDPEDLKGFHAEGYWYNPELSKTDKLVFTRG